jgi:hypothetical protein
MTRGRLVVAGVSLALLIGVAPAAHAGSWSRAPLTDHTPPVPDGFALADYVPDPGFESGDSGFIPGSPLDGTVALDRSDPIDGASSLHASLNAFGRVSVVAQFPFQAGPFADSVTVAGKLRVDSSVPAGKSVSVCSVAYVTTDQEPRTLCQSFPVDPSHVVDVFVSQPMGGARLDRAYFLLKLDDNGTLDVTLDDAHLYVVGRDGAPPLPTVPDGFSLHDLVSDNGFETSKAKFAAFSRSEGSVSRSTVDPIAGVASLKVHNTPWGRVGLVHNYPYDGGPIADSVTVAGKIRIDRAPPGRELQVCAIAYYFLDQEPEQTCRDLSVNDHRVQTVFITQPAHGRQLDRAFFQLKLDDFGTIDATVDDAHLYVVGQP